MARQIDVGELRRRLQAGENINLLDVRESIEFHTFNIGGINIPLSSFAENLIPVTYNKTDEIVVICKIGMRSRTAVQLLAKRGYINARNLKGGLIALQKIEQQHN